MNDSRSWREIVEQFWTELSDAEAEEFRAGALVALDEAARRRELTPMELGRLAALAEYLSNRLGRRIEDASLDGREAILYGLLAGYQLGAACGNAVPTPQPEYASNRRTADLHPNFGGRMWKLSQFASKNARGPVLRPRPRRSAAR